MGRILFEFVIPGLVAFAVIVWLLRNWYVRFFGRHVRNWQQVKKASDKYDRDLNK